MCYLLLLRALFPEEYPLEIRESAISAVLLPGGWVRVDDAQLLSVTSPAKWQTALAMRDFDTQQYVYAPMSSILAIRTPDGVQSTEGFREDAAQKKAREEALFEWRHYAAREVYEAAAAAQNGLCATCRIRLKQSPITHFHEGKVYCQYHTPLEHRYGEPE